MSAPRANRASLSLDLETNRPVPHADSRFFRYRPGPFCDLNRGIRPSSDGLEEEGVDNMSEIKIERHMVKSPYCIESSAGLRESSDMMAEYGIRHLPVVDEGLLVGLISERDVREGLAAGGDKLRVQDVMKADVYAVMSSTPLLEVIEEMSQMKIGSAVVINRHREVVGIFTTIDALELLAAYLEDQGADILLEDEMESWSPRRSDEYEHTSM